MIARRELPTGVDKYIEAVTKCYYVDKTEIIGDLLPVNSQVFLFTRPRRFGKTLTMDMLKTFFEISKEDTSVYFRDKKVWAMGERVTKEQGKYPVISLSFKGADCETWDETFDQLKLIIWKEFSRHEELANSDKVIKSDLAMYDKIVAQVAPDSNYRVALDTLERMLHKHYGVSPIVLIDEYDAPIQAGYENGYYNKVISFIKDFFSNGLKSNPDLSLGVLTGVLRVSKESIFSDLNNLNIYSILRRKGEEPDEKEMEESDRYRDEDLPERIDPCFTSYFGFTLDEVKEMLRYYGYSRKIDEVVEWYDGYTFGDAEVFNPLSVLTYIRSGCIAGKYWVNTSGNGILGDMLERTNKDIEAKLAALLQGETITSPISESVVYADLNKKAGRNKNLFSMLLFSGYLKAVGVAEESEDQNAAYMSVMPDSDSEGDDEDGEDGEEENDTEYLLKIPNKEVRMIFRTEILDRMQVESDSLLADIWSALKRRDAAALEEPLRSYLLTAISVYDVGGSEISEDRRANNEYEAFYHGMWMGFVAYKSRSYYIRSNIESGDGRLDLSLEPNNKRYPAMILEFKHLKDKDKSLRDLANSALSQIDDKHYDADLKDRGCKNIIKVGIAYHGKDVAVAM